MSGGPTWSGDRRTFLKTTGAVGVGALAGCTGGDDTPVRFILNPAEANVDMQVQYRPIKSYLEEETGADIELQRTETYTETLQALDNEQGELADTSPSAAVAGSEYADVIGIRVAFGASQYFSTITTMPDSGIDELADLEGSEIACSSVLSVSGTLVPLVMLKRAGLDVGNAPDGDPVDFDMTNSDHFTAFEQMMERENVGAAGTGAFVSAPHVPKEQFEEMSQDFVEISSEYEGAGSEDPAVQLLSVSDPLPRAPLMSRSNWEDPIREDIEEALLEAPPEAFEHEEEVDEDNELWFNGVEPGSLEDFEPIQEVLDELGLEFEDLS